MTTVPSLLAGVLVVLLVSAVTGLLGMVSLSDVLRRLVPQPQPSPAVER